MQKRSNVLACLHGAWAPPSHAPLPAQEFFWGAVQRAGGVRSWVIPTSHGDIPPGRGIVLPQNSAVCFVPLHKGGVRYAQLPTTSISANTDVTDSRIKVSSANQDDCYITLGTI